MQAAVAAVFRESGSHTIFREVKYKFVFVGETCSGGIFKPGVPVRFHLILAAQVSMMSPSLIMTYSEKARNPEKAV